MVQLGRVVCYQIRGCFIRGCQGGCGGCEGSGSRDRSTTVVQLEISDKGTGCWQPRGNHEIFCMLHEWVGDQVGCSYCKLGDETTTNVWTLGHGLRAKSIVYRDVGQKDVIVQSEAQDQVARLKLLKKYQGQKPLAFIGTSNRMSAQYYKKDIRGTVQLLALTQFRQTVWPISVQRERLYNGGMGFRVMNRRLLVYKMSLVGF